MRAMEKEVHIRYAYSDLKPTQVVPMKSGYEGRMVIEDEGGESSFRGRKLVGEVLVLHDQMEGVVVAEVGKGEYEMVNRFDRVQQYGHDQPVVAQSSRDFIYQFIQWKRLNEALH